MCLALIVSRVFAYCYCRLVRPLFEKPVPSSVSRAPKACSKLEVCTKRKSRERERKRKRRLTHGVAVQGSPARVAAVVLVVLGAGLGGGHCSRADHPHLSPHEIWLHDTKNTHTTQTHLNTGHSSQNTTHGK